MKVRKVILTSLMSLATLTPAKAQRSVEFISETGITGVIKQDALAYSGMNLGITAGKNYTDIFAGMNINPQKQASFLGLALNNYSWNKTLSTWVRGVISASDRNTNTFLEVAPIRGNVKTGRFNFSLSPAYTMYNDFRTSTTTQGVNTIFQATYSLSPADKFFVEAKYTTDPAKNLFNTHFGKLQDNISYMIAYMRNISWKKGK